MAYTEAGGTSGFIADHQSTDNMQVEYSRNAKSFPINLYSELRPVKKTRGFYLRIKPEQAARVPNADGREFAWPDGADSPTGTDNQEQFEFEPYLCRRYAHAVRLSNRAIDQTAWDVAEVEMRAKGQQAMTLLARKAALALSGASWGGNTSTVAGISGVGGAHHWGNGTVANPWLKISLQYAAILINQATLGVVTPKDLVLVFSPDTATAISQSGEIQAMLSNSVYAYPLLTGTLPGAAQRNWSLPPMLYDFRIAVEDTVVVTTRKGNASQAYQYSIPKGTAYLLTRKENELINPTIEKADAGEIALEDEDRENVPVTSTIVRFSKEDMTTETKADPWERRTAIRIANDYDFQITQPLSGFQFLSCFG